MKKFLFILFGLFVIAGAFATGENIPTSKSYVDSKLGEKQDIIPANDGAARVLTNTGMAGEYGTKGIYDANGEYATQTQNLVDAATMNAGVQNAINSEFQCIEWLDPNDHSSDCLLMDVFGQTEHRSPNLFDVNQITNTSQITNNGDVSITFISSGASSAISTGKKLSRLAPDLISGKQYTINFDTTSGLKFITLYKSGGSTYWGPNTTLTITDDLLNRPVYLNTSVNSTATISNIQITEGTVATPYVPYGNLYIPAGE